VSSKQDKFKDLMRSPNGSNETKESMITGPTKTSAEQFVQILGKKKATFELDAELHYWLKIHAVRTNQKMVDVVEDILKQYRAEQEEDL
jgi:hemerythrin